ncbi:MAG: ABC transporter ATP-binding protein [Clostridiales bacterium]|nr:ABC transporter ATP-binding protein [Clostridiales bacterium]
MTHVIECDALTKSYGANRGIEEVTLRIEPGTTFGFLGPNGAGKTTTIRCLLGMLRPTGGEARVFGERVTLDGAAIRKRIGYVAGDVRLYERETGRWHIEHISRLRAGSPRSADELIDRLEFDPSRKVRELSKGNKQKLALVLGFMHDPELLVLDEPTSGLDPLNQETVFDIVGERVSAGATLFLSSHILSEVEQVCERVGIIREGRLVAEEDVGGLISKRVRDLAVTFDGDVPTGLFDGIDGVTSVAVSGTSTLTARVRGDVVDAVVKQLAHHRLADLSIAHAKLEEVFREYYAPGAGEGEPR